jgi:hypothetical protein
MTQKCAQVGPRGGRCRRNAQVVKGLTIDSTLDFCQPHDQMVRDGVKLNCSRCGAMVTAGLQLV